MAPPSQAETSPGEEGLQGIAQPEQRVDADVDLFLQRFSMILSAKLFNFLSALPAISLVLSALGPPGLVSIVLLVLLVYRVSVSLP